MIHGSQIARVRGDRKSQPPRERLELPLLSIIFPWSPPWRCTFVPISMPRGQDKVGRDCISFTSTEHSLNEHLSPHGARALFFWRLARFFMQNRGGTTRSPELSLMSLVMLGSYRSTPRNGTCSAQELSWTLASLVRTRIHHGSTCIRPYLAHRCQCQEIQRYYRC